MFAAQGEDLATFVPYPAAVGRRVCSWEHRPGSVLSDLTLVFCPSGSAVIRHLFYVWCRILVDFDLVRWTRNSTRWMASYLFCSCSDFR